MQEKQLAEAAAYRLAMKRVYAELQNNRYGFAVLCCLITMPCDACCAHAKQLRCRHTDLTRWCRRRWLLEQSRSWIRADQLDARIELALDNPEQLFSSGAAS